MRNIDPVKYSSDEGLEEILRVYGSSEAIRIARELNPTLVIFARSSYLSELPELRKAGADIVFSGEGEIALAMTEFLLRQLGATSEQVDRERGASGQSSSAGQRTMNPCPRTGYGPLAKPKHRHKNAKVRGEVEV